MLLLSDLSSLLYLVVLAAFACVAVLIHRISDNDHAPRKIFCLSKYAAYPSGGRHKMKKFHPPILNRKPR